MSASGSPKGPVDLNELLNNPRIKVGVKTEDQADAAHRRQQEITDTAHRHRLFWWLFAALALCLTGAVIGLSIADDPDTRELARSMIALIVGAFVGFASGVKVPR